MNYLIIKHTYAEICQDIYSILHHPLVESHSMHDSVVRFVNGDVLYFKTLENATRGSLHGYNCEKIYCPREVHNSDLLHYILIPSVVRSTLPFPERIEFI